MPQIMKFAVVGVVNTLVDFSCFMGLTHLGVSIFIANFVSTSLGLCSSYFGNRYFTFGRPKGVETAKGILQTLVSFVFFTGMGIWVLQPLVIWVSTLLLANSLPNVLTVAIAKIFGICVGMIWSFVMYKFVVFKSPRHSDSHRE